MVNSAGQALLSLPVDSTNKADFSQPPSALAIPRQTVSEFRATTEVELGLNLPSNVEPITLEFNPNKPETYHRTTSLTVFGASGSQHLATVYYVKTQAATSEDPFNKWQTHVYIDGERIYPGLIQASDTGGDEFFVNKYGEIKTKSELEFCRRLLPTVLSTWLRRARSTGSSLTTCFLILLSPPRLLSLSERVTRPTYLPCRWLEVQTVWISPVFHQNQPS